jgi:hypothetical protein
VKDRKALCKEFRENEAEILSLKEKIKVLEGELEKKTLEKVSILMEISKVSKDR